MPDGITPDTSAAAAAQRIDNDIAAVQRELARKNVGDEQRQILQGELDKLQSQRAATAVHQAAIAEPNLDAAVRVKQTSDAMDSSRLTPDDDLPGRDRHQQALETASDQIARGDPVQVSDVMPSPHTEPIVPAPVDIVRTKAGELDVAATEAALPPVAGGDVRLYRAESPTTGFSDVFNPDDLAAHRHQEIPGSRYTTDLKVADYYRDAYNGKGDASIHYIDVPREVAERGRIADDEFKVHLQAENAVRAQAARVHETAQAVQQIREARQEPEGATKPNAQAFHDARAAAAKGAGEMPVKATQEPAAEAGSGVSDAALDAAIGRLDPNMMVHLDGMPGAVRLVDLMESLKAEAAAQGRDAKLLEVAAQCALSFPSVA